MKKIPSALVAMAFVLLVLQTTQAQKPKDEKSKAKQFQTQTVPVECVECNPCPDCPPDPPLCLSPNPIDDAQFFVSQHYRDFLGREPNEPPDSDFSGRDFWTGQITQCGSNAQCVADKRVDVSRAFWESSEFHQGSITFGLNNTNPPPQYNNDEFVRLAFVIYLQRFPALNDPLFVDRVNRLNSCTGNPGTNGSNGYNCYQSMIREFITSAEYRTRFGCP